MQAGLVSQRLALRDIFTAGGLTRRIFVAVVHVSVTVQPTESDEAELSTRCLAVGSETGCLINSERCKHPGYAGPTTASRSGWRCQVDRIEDSP